MRFRSLALVPAAVLAAGGCIQGERLIKVNADGSGTVEDTMNYTAEAKEMKASFEAMDQTPAADKAKKKKEKLGALATGMGEGVSLVSADSTKDGGEKTVYSFKDINKVNLGCFPSSSDETPGKKSDDYTFKLAKQGGRSVLTVSEPPSTATAKKPEKTPTKEEQAQAETMMKKMMAGAKVACRVVVNGTISKTNSAYQAGSTVTLMEIDFDQLAADPGSLAKLASFQDKPSPKDLAGVKGLKAATSDVVVEFSGK
jgi:hypothetical protein